MSAFRHFPRRFRLPWRSPERIRSEVDEEIAFHLEMRTEELVASGMDAERARAQAREEFGDPERAGHSLHAADEAIERRRRRIEWLRDLGSELRYAFRTLLRSRGFTVVAVLTLALGIGLATAVWTIADALLIRPLPVRDQDRVVVLWGASRDGRLDNFPLLLSGAREFERSARSLERVAFFSYGGAHPVAVRETDHVVRLNWALVSGDFFSLLGTQPLLGRALRPEDDVRGAAPVVVLSYHTWQRDFGGNPRVVGRNLVLHQTGVSQRIVGVMPPGLDYPRGTDFWAPVYPNSGPMGSDSVYNELNVLGRLRPGASPAQARDELTAYFERLDGADWMHQMRGVVQPLATAILGDVRPAILAFAAAAGLLLLITCINVANLLVVRGRARVREIAVRSALGAGRRRLVAQLVTESVLLASVGGLLGVGLAAWSVRAFVALAPQGTPRLAEIHVSGSLIWGAVAITALVAVLSGLAPALASSRVDLRTALGAGSSRTGASRRSRRGTEALVVGQVALTLVVLTVAGLITRSLVRIQEVELGWHPSHLLFADISLPDAGFGDATQQVAALDRLVPAIQAIPGVLAVSPVLTPPFTGSGAGGIVGTMAAEGQSPAEQGTNPALSFEVVTPDYFETLDIPVLRGRALSDRDREGSLPVVVLSQSAARHYWPKENPVGKRLLGPERRMLTVVGIVPDTRYREVRVAKPSVYFPLRQSTFPVAPMTLAIRADRPPVALVPTIRRAIQETLPGAAVSSATPFRDLFGRELEQPRLNALLLGLFALASVVLAIVGLYGVVATMVRQRTGEFGVRLALGATAPQIGALVLRRGLALAAGGVSVGLLGALVTGRLAASLLFEIDPADVPTLVSVSLLLLAVATLASLIPARASSRIDPATTLRGE